MTMSNSPTAPARILPPSPDRGSLRLRMAQHAGVNHLDGGWWPRSRDLAVELADLVDHLPPQFGRILRATVSPPDWDERPRRVLAQRGYVKVGGFPHDDTHEVLVQTSDRTMLHLLVVPPQFSEAHGTEALFAAATAGNAHGGTELLREVLDGADSDPRDHWSDDGGSW